MTGKFTGGPIEIRMNRLSPWRNRWIIVQAPVWILFILGLWGVVLRAMGPNLEFVPGDLGDARFNNYILEHFFRWISGLDHDYWNAAFFYPYQKTIAFSDNLLGSAPVYALLRWAGLDRMAAFQGWYILGYGCNYLAAAYVLSRFKLKPLAAAVGAFFFTFGLPLLAQENHAQLLYHFCVPLACYFLWKFYERPRLTTLAALGFWLVWQFFLTIYIGIFLLILLAVLAVLLPFCVQAPSIRARLALWPRRLITAWSEESPGRRILAGLVLIALGASFVALIRPYRQVAIIYHFSRSWNEVLLMLPTPASYLLADRSQLWGASSGNFSNLQGRVEHQLFPGAAVLALTVTGIAGRFHSKNSRLAWLNLAAVLVMVALTLNIHGVSLYHVLWQLPGMNSLRAVSRIQLVIMWPMAVFSAWVIDAATSLTSPRSRWLSLFIYLLAGLLLVESVLYHHLTFSKNEAQARLDKIHQQIPAVLPEEPILFVARNPLDPAYAPELDAMLAAQDLGWPTLNGYSGNSPPGYTSAGDTCRRLPERIISYLDNAGKTDPSDYTGFMKRVVPVGFGDCDPAWWNSRP